MERYAIPRLALLVTQDTEQRHSLADALSTAAFDVIECAIPVAAELIVAKVGPDLHVLISDLSRPEDPDKTALAEFAAAFFPHLKIISVAGEEQQPLPGRAHRLAKSCARDEIVRLAAA